MNDSEWESFKKTVKPIDKTKKVIPKRFINKPKGLKSNSSLEIEDLEIILSNSWGQLENNIHTIIISINLNSLKL